MPTLLSGPPLTAPVLSSLVQNTSICVFFPRVPGAGCLCELEVELVPMTPGATESPSISLPQTPVSSLGEAAPVYPAPCTHWAEGSMAWLHRETCQWHIEDAISHPVRMRDLFRRKQALCPWQNAGMLMGQGCWGAQ